MHKIVIIEQETNEPKEIAKNDFFKSRFEMPAIILPDHTPVSGNGIATKTARAKYFLKLPFLFSIFALLAEYLYKNLFVKKPAVCFLIFLVTNIIIKQGKIDAKNDKNKAEIGLNALPPQMSVFSAKGIEIFVSNVGIKATSITASQTQFSKLLEKKSLIKFIL